MPPPKKTPGKLGSDAGRELLTRAEYHLLAILQRPFGWVFWRIEQWKAQIQDRVENERNDR